MIQYERQRLILGALRAADVARIEDLVKATGASPSTVRRDVDLLVRAGQVIALRGGAIRLNEHLVELPSLAKSLINKTEKNAIAMAAARTVKNGDTIYIDSGTTTLQMMQYLRGLRVQIVTSNTSLLTQVPDEQMQITILAGDYLANIGSIVGSLTEQLLSNMFFDKAFIGANGCSTKGGITTFDIREATKKRLAHEHSTESYVLIDDTKFGKTATHRAFGVADCVLVTNAPNDLLAGAKSYIVADQIAGGTGDEAAAS